MILTLSREEIAMQNRGPGQEKIEQFLKMLTDTGGFELNFEILACNDQVQSPSGDPAGATPPAPLAGDPQPSGPLLSVEFSGPDTPLLLDRNGELLHALEHIAAKILRLEPEDHDRVSFDAQGFKANRDRQLQLSAEAAIQKVRTTGQPFAFPPMTSRERRMLHLALHDSGLPTASSGENPRRFVVLYPEGYQPENRPSAPTPRSSQDRTRDIRNTFRRR